MDLRSLFLWFIAVISCLSGTHGGGGGHHHHIIIKVPHIVHTHKHTHTKYIKIHEDKGHDEHSHGGHPFEEHIEWHKPHWH